MNWLSQSLWWYLILLGIGLLSYPITRKLFPKFYDHGYPFAKTISIIIISYAIFLLSTLKLLPFTQESLLLIVFILAVINFFIFRKEKFKRPQLIFILGEELLFLFSFLFWVIVRGQEPAIHGLEKFMDFGFMNSIGRTTYFPPLDMWLSGHTINYYYFGHLTGAVLTKLSGFASYISYNLILDTIFALAITQTFSLCMNLVYKSFGKIQFGIIGGILGTFIVNLAGNFHTIYLFTKGYPNENPIPFWKIFSWFNPEKYWYPNATRFIPFTIHEFPIYSYVVADLHGHVFDIPFVLLTLAILFNLFHSYKEKVVPVLESKVAQEKSQNYNLKKKSKKKTDSNFPEKKAITESGFDIKTYLISNRYSLIFTIILGFMLAIHYMTNAWDLLVYGALTLILFFFLYGVSIKLLINVILLGLTYFIFSLPFSLNFTSIVSSIGVNCSPQFFVELKKITPFIFEKNNCQLSPPWMLFILWGFFWINFIFFSIYYFLNRKKINNVRILTFIVMLFSFSTFLILIPEFFYFKDIYPNHFRANTMFKLGYQAFIMMGIASAFTFILFTKHLLKNRILFPIYMVTFILDFLLIAVYPNFAIPSYYGGLTKKPVLEGNTWMNTTYPEYNEIISYLNENIKGQPTILEAQGDSYTDFNVVSAYTGLPTVAGWWVHEWLWRDDSNAVGALIPSIQGIYESTNDQATKDLIRKFNISYIIIGPNEKQKYPQLNEEKFNEIGSLIFTSKNGNGKIYSVAPMK